MPFRCLAVYRDAMNIDVIRYQKFSKMIILFDFNIVCSDFISMTLV